MSAPVIFLGPSLKLTDARAILDADYRPPAQRGDVIRAVEGGAGVIGLIDGFTHLVPAVTHKEILFALSRGVRVYGAASLGALRAAELGDYGMIGIGRIFEDYRAGKMTSDEVALCHGPAELGYCAVSEAMVNVRATIAAAVAAGLLTHSADALLEIARSTHFAVRTWPQLLEAAARRNLPLGELDSFKAWLPVRRADPKRFDAVAMLEAVRDGRQHADPASVRSFEFRPTQAFAALHRSVTAAERRSAAAE